MTLPGKDKMHDAADTMPPIESLLAQHRPYLLRFAKTRLRDGALVEDVVQETLLAALQGRERFASRSTLRTWLTGILLNKIAEHVRRDRRGQPAVHDDDNEHDGIAHDAPIAFDSGDESAGDEPIEWRDPARLLEGRQFIEQLHRRLDKLPPLAARAFTLREIDGWSLEEIARELDVTAGHTAVLLHRARNRLRAGFERV